MRGGVSLAVWIGGACAEIDRLRRAGEASQGFWGKVTRLAGYDKVLVDVLAGASAGGLNGVLYSAAQVYQSSLDPLRDIWLDVGGTENLVRTKPPWLSLFKGDEQLLAKAHEALSLLAKGPEDGFTEPPDHLDLRLSTTLVKPIKRTVPNPSGAPAETERRSSSGFHFEHHTDTWLGTHFAAPADQTRHGADLWRLALAARAT